MKKYRIMQFGIAAEAVVFLLLLASGGFWTAPAAGSLFSAEKTSAEMEKHGAGEEEYPVRVDFDVTEEALDRAYRYDVATYGSKEHVDWIALLACAAAENGGDFRKFQENDLKKAAEVIRKKGTEELKKKNPSFAYYYESYLAVLGGLVGEYEVMDDTSSNQWKKEYGLKAFSPIAGGFAYEGYDDFGAERNFGYKRPHLGHDMLGDVGTPIVAIESGYVTALGWNPYGGWRVGISSFDKKRYYYYAHMRQDRPYAEGLKVGDVVTAGDVIGYIGRTGYSKTENVNNIEVYHLHVGMQLIFDESQREGEHEIWIDMYALTEFLDRHRSEVVRNAQTKEWKRKNPMKDPAVERFIGRRQGRKR